MTKAEDLGHQLNCRMKDQRKSMDKRLEDYRQTTMANKVAYEHVTRWWLTQSDLRWQACTVADRKLE